MKIVREVSLINRGDFAKSREWATAKKKLHAAIKKVGWPKGSRKFTIYAEKGKGRGKGNGVKPIKEGLMLDLKAQGYDLQSPAVLTDNRRFGSFDALLHTSRGPAVVEWETGNIFKSSLSEQDGTFPH